ncbi:MAG: hypothetical protein KGK03_00810 [Candidatus Omnitrophica bacterium]|nr:hypothetical protein [Candidatus Omnitrophota bacterium]
MSLIREIEEAIAKLPIREAYMLRHWLNEYETAREYKKLKAQAVLNHHLSEFKHDHGNAFLN